MKYNETSKFPKFIGGTGLITLLACCLIAIGIAAWFAVSRNNALNENLSSNQGGSSENESYYMEDKTYNSNAQIPEENTENFSTDVDENVADVPYESTPSEETVESEEKRGFILPVEGNISKGFSSTALQYSATYGDMRLHTGIDILCEKGSNVKSAGAGTVTEVGEDATLGKYITIDHGDGITVKYCGFASINVKENDTVSAGISLGTSGEVPSECADKPHIHIEADIIGENVSPLTAFGLN